MLEVQHCYNVYYSVIIISVRHCFTGVNQVHTSYTDHNHAVPHVRLQQQPKICGRPIASSQIDQQAVVHGERRGANVIHGRGVQSGPRPLNESCALSGGGVHQ
jgi:hypothetical protein